MREHIRTGHTSDAKGLCRACAMAKARSRSHSRARPHAFRELSFNEQVHCDMVGPVHPKSISGCQYYVSITDGYSRLVEAYPVKQKSDAVDALKAWVHDERAGRHLNVPLPFARSLREGAGEAFLQWLESGED